MNCQVRHQGKRIRDRRLAAGFGGFHHIQLLDHDAILVAQERKTGAQTGPERRVNLGRIDANHRELTVVDRQLFLKFRQVAQLHLAFGSPIAPIKDRDERELSGYFRELDLPPVVVRKFQIRETFANGLIHASISFARGACSKDLDGPRLRISRRHVVVQPVALQALKQAEIHDGRVPGYQGLGCQLSSARENNVRVETVPFKEPRFLRYPDVNLIIRDGGITEFDLFQLLAVNQRDEEKKQQPHARTEKTFCYTIQASIQIRTAPLPRA